MSQKSSKSHSSKSKSHSKSSKSHVQSKFKSSSTPSIALEFQGVSKTHMSHIWDLLKQGEVPQGEAYVLARSMADHKHWYALFETIGIFDSDPSHYVGDVDPYLHIQLHRMIGLQILNRTPRQAFDFYQARIRKQEDPHEIIHMMIEIFKQHMMKMVEQIVNDEQIQSLHKELQGVDSSSEDEAIHVQLNQQQYALQLKKLQTKTRKYIWQVLGFEKIPHLHSEQELIL